MLLDGYSVTRPLFCYLLFLPKLRVALVLEHLGLHDKDRGVVWWRKWGSDKLANTCGHCLSQPLHDFGLQRRDLEGGKHGSMAVADI